jgi:hypothetical protein
MAENSAVVGSEQHSEPKPDELIREAFYNEVRDAASVLEFAVSQGRTLEPTLIPRIKKGQGFLSVGVRWPGDDDRSDFESAYRDLAQAMQPVTAATLQCTRDEGWIPSPARRFSKRLYLWVFLCAALIVLDKVSQAQQTSGGIWPTVKTVSHTLLPFVYGLVGALTYLLRSAHFYIADRSFDLNRRPEYYNRMVLGFLAGGCVLVFGDATKASTAGPEALSFLVGYNTDYLFQMIERVAQAIFPKDGKQGAVPGLASISLEKDTIKSGDAGNATIVLTGKAPASGVLVSLTADSGITLSSASVKVSEGSSSASFTFKVDSGQTPGARLHITAKQDSTSVMATVTVA